MLVVVYLFDQFYLFVFIYFIPFWNSSKVNFISFSKMICELCEIYLFSHLLFVFLLFLEQLQAFCEEFINRDCIKHISHKYLLNEHSEDLSCIH